MKSGIKILIVDDLENECKTLKNILDKKGYTVYTATKSGDAIELAKGVDLDLILMDLILKGDKNGVEIFKEIKKIKPDVKSIFYTAYGPQEETKLIHEALLAGMIDEILRKPIWPDELIQAIEKHTGGKDEEKDTGSR